MTMTKKECSMWFNIYTKENLTCKSEGVRKAAKKYFDDIAEILGEYKTEFTKEEAELLEMNFLIVPEISIIN